MSDIWTDGNYCPFLTITAYWVSKDDTGSLKLNVGFIAFHHIPSTHTGVNLVLIILHLLDHAGVTDKVTSYHILCVINVILIFCRLAILHWTMPATMMLPCEN